MLPCEKHGSVTSGRGSRGNGWPRGHPGERGTLDSGLWCLSRRCALAERVTLHHLGDDVREPVVLARCITSNTAYHGHVVVLEGPADGIGHQLPGEGLYKQLRARQQRFAEVIGTFDRRAVRQHPTGIYWRVR